MCVLVSKSSNQPNEIGFPLSWVNEAAPGFVLVVTVWRRTTVDNPGVPGLGFPVTLCNLLHFSAFVSLCVFAVCCYTHAESNSCRVPELHLSSPGRCRKSVPDRPGKTLPTQHCVMIRV